ncbi:MAG: alpha/beta family hydrolase [Gemmatimonadota bacterium]
MPAVQLFGTLALMTSTSHRFLADPAAADPVMVSARLVRPPGSMALLVFGHGAGAGMEHPFMEFVSDLLAVRKVATFRYNFPYKERGRRMPDSAAVLETTVRSAVREADRKAGDLPLLAGGKSMGGRISSQAQAREPLPGVRGLVLFGFPLHPAGRPGVTRAAHLSQLDVPLLFHQGTRDKLADLELLQPIIERLGTQAALAVHEGADHGFHVLKRSGRSDAEVLKEVTSQTAAWLERKIL